MSIGSSFEELSIDMESFKEVLNYQPVSTEKEEEEPTLFDISDYSHYENVISNWYKFFLEANNPHGFGNLFYSSLRQLLDLKDRGDSSCEVEREYVTDNGRIDLLVFEGKDGDDKFQHPIIIENKIYADLADNDLKDYSDSIEEKGCHPPTPKKLVLSLYGNEDEGNDTISKKVKDNCYKVRSHRQYMDVIKKNLPSYIVDKDSKYFMLLQDFMSNIEKLTRMAKMGANSKWYFSNAAKIDELVKIRSDAQEVVIGNFSKAISDKQDWKWRRQRAGDKHGLMSVEITDVQVSFYISLNGLKYVVKLITWSKWAKLPLPQRWDTMSELDKDALRKVLDRVSGTVQECTEPNVIRQVEYVIGESDEALDQYHKLIIDTIEDEWMPFVKELRALNLKDK